MDILTNIVQWLSGKLKEFDGRGNVRNYIGKKNIFICNGEKRLKRLDWWKWKIKLSFLIHDYIMNDWY